MNGFSDLELKYRKIQINGTVYVITRLQLSSEQLVALEAGAGELFLSHIQKFNTAEDIMKVAIELGDVYKLRFKISYSGSSRGYAYLQYIEERNMKVALTELRLRFSATKLYLQVRQSRNKRELLLRNVPHLTPLQVYEELRHICNYIKLRCYEYKPQCYAYIIEYRNNDDAALVHQTLRNKQKAFGTNALIDWVNKEMRKSRGVPAREAAACSSCVQLKRSQPMKHLLELTEHRCFKI